MDDGTFPALLKTLSDSSEEVGESKGSMLNLANTPFCEGYQTRSAIVGSDIVKLRRGLLQSVHDEPIGALQHRSYSA